MYEGPLLKEAGPYRYRSRCTAYGAVRWVYERPISYTLHAFSSRFASHTQSSRAPMSCLVRALPPRAATQ